MQDSGAAKPRWFFAKTMSLCELDLLLLGELSLLPRRQKRRAATAQTVRISDIIAGRITAAPNMNASNVTQSRGILSSSISAK